MSNNQHFSTKSFFYSNPFLVHSFLSSFPSLGNSQFYLWSELAIFPNYILVLGKGIEKYHFESLWFKYKDSHRLTYLNALSPVTTTWGLIGGPLLEEVCHWRLALKFPKSITTLCLQHYLHMATLLPSAGITALCHTQKANFQSF